MKIKNNVKCFISMIAIILYPSMFMYFQNMSEGPFIEILPSIGKNLILAVVLLVAFSVLFRNIRKAFLTSEIALLLFMNFNLIKFLSYTDVFCLSVIDKLRQSLDSF